MHGAQAIPFKASLLAAAVGLAVAVGAPRDAHAQIVVVAPPPPTFVATFQPEYFEGRPVYWYHNNWYYRGEHGWSYYRSEPRYLRERRSHWVDHPRYRYHR
jgi:hypothetical protein